VDSGSSCNYCSARLVKKLAFLTKPHPKSYKLEWINGDGSIVVKKTSKYTYFHRKIFWLYFIWYCSYEN